MIICYVLMSYELSATFSPLFFCTTIFHTTFLTSICHFENFIKHTCRKIKPPLTLNLSKNVLIFDQILCNIEMWTVRKPHDYLLWICIWTTVLFWADFLSVMSFLWPRVTESEGLRSKSKTPLKSAILFYRLMQISNQPSIRIYSYLVACMAGFRCMFTC